MNPSEMNLLSEKKPTTSLSKNCWSLMGNVAPQSLINFDCFIRSLLYFLTMVCVVCLCLLDLLLASCFSFIGECSPQKKGITIWWYIIYLLGCSPQDSKSLRMMHHHFGTTTFNLRRLDGGIIIRTMWWWWINWRDTWESAHWSSYQCQ